MKIKSTFLPLTAAAVAIAFTTSSAQAATVYSDIAATTRVTGTVRSENSSGGTYSYTELCPTGTCTGSYSNRTYGDLATGKLGAAGFVTERTGGPYSGAYSQWSDELSFDFAGDETAREISFNFSVDGSVALDPPLTGGFNNGRYVLYIEAFGIKDPGTGFLSAYQGAVGGVAYIFNPTTTGYAFGPAGCSSSVAIFGCTGSTHGSTVGKLTSFSVDGVAGSFLAKEGEFYRITAGLGTNGTADFYNTGTFRFANLGTGVSMQSASGVFLSNAAAVPEPATWAMMIVGFGAVGASIRYGRRKSSLATA
jgi:hypothetical protein